jgi:hypothetical protein
MLKCRFIIIINSTELNGVGEFVVTGGRHNVSKTSKAEKRIKIFLNKIKKFKMKMVMAS